MNIAKPATLAFFLLLALLVSSCGFQLRGAAALPIETI
jgi:outer membrane lipopolysaccharide assembly protein LptE/RlpB